MLYNCLYQYIKMNEWNSIECNSVEETYYQKNRYVILNRAKDYYENDEERLRARDKYKPIWRRKKWKAKLWKKPIS